MKKKKCFPLFFQTKFNQIQEPKSKLMRCLKSSIMGERGPREDGRGANPGPPLLVILLPLLNLPVFLIHQRHSSHRKLSHSDLLLAAHKIYVVNPFWKVHFEEALCSSSLEVAPLTGLPHFLKVLTTFFLHFMMPLSSIITFLCHNTA